MVAEFQQLSLNLSRAKWSGGPMISYQVFSELKNCVNANWLTTKRAFPKIIYFAYILNFWPKRLWNTSPSLIKGWRSYFLFSKKVENNYRSLPVKKPIGQIQSCSIYRQFFGWRGSSNPAYKWKIFGWARMTGQNQFYLLGEWRS